LILLSVAQGLDCGPDDWGTPAVRAARRLGGL
jgi:hypothetical protein